MKITPGRIVKVSLIALLATIGFDLFLHAGVLGPFYASDSPFLLPQIEAFRRIPIGYLSFAAALTLLVWLMSRMGVEGWQNGFIFGIKVGVLVWASLALGLYSISTANPWLLLGWFLGQTLETGIGGAVIGSGLGRISLRSLLFRVAAFAFGMVVLGIIFQNVINFAPL